MNLNSYRDVLGAFIKVTLDAERIGPFFYTWIQEPGENPVEADEGLQPPVSAVQTYW